MTKSIAIIAALAGASAAASASPAWEDLPSLDARVEAQIGAPIGVPGGAVAPIDRRLKLAACPEPATIDPPANGAVAIRCAPLGWRLRVPLSAGTSGVSASNEIAVRRGDLIELEYEGEGFSASASGVALDDAAVGKAVRVKTSTSQAVAAVASGNGRARISP